MPDATGSRTPLGDPDPALVAAAERLAGVVERLVRAEAEVLARETGVASAQAGAALARRLDPTVWELARRLAAESRVVGLAAGSGTGWDEIGRLLGVRRSGLARTLALEGERGRAADPTAAALFEQVAAELGLEPE